MDMSGADNLMRQSVLWLSMFTIILSTEPCTDVLVVLFLHL
jgi:hypothetical protein